MQPQMINMEPGKMDAFTIASESSCLEDDPNGALCLKPNKVPILFFLLKLVTTVKVSRLLKSR